VYDAVVKGSIRGLLAGVKPGENVRERERIANEIEEDEKTGRVGLRKRTRQSRVSIAPAVKSVAEVGAEHAFRTKRESLSPAVNFALQILNPVCGFAGGVQ
jgi:hypothetical protein